MGSYLTDEDRVFNDRSVAIGHARQLLEALPVSPGREEALRRLADPHGFIMGGGSIRLAGEATPETLQAVVQAIHALHPLERLADDTLDECLAAAARAAQLDERVDDGGAAHSPPSQSPPGVDPRKRDRMETWMRRTLESEGAHVPASKDELVRAVLGRVPVRSEPKNPEPADMDAAELLFLLVADDMGLRDRLCVCPPFMHGYWPQNASYADRSVVDAVLDSVACAARADLMRARLDVVKQRMAHWYRLSEFDVDLEVAVPGCDGPHAGVVDAGRRCGQEDAGAVQLDKRVDEGGANGLRP